MPQKLFEEFQAPTSAKVTLEAAGDGKRKKISIAGAMVADKETANGRVYPTELVKAEVARIKAVMESGVSVEGGLDGEAEHPQHKPTWRPNLLETVVKWTNIEFDEATNEVNLEGVIANTQKGRDVVELYELGVPFGVSQRAYAESEYRVVGNRELEFMTSLEIKAYDLTRNPAVSGQTVKVESKDKGGSTVPDKTKIEDLSPAEAQKLLIETIRKSTLEGLEKERKEQVEAEIKRVLGVETDEQVIEAITKLGIEKKSIDEAKTAREVAASIDEATKELPYSESINKQFVESVKDAKPQNAAEVAVIVESKRKEYDALVAQARLEGKGYHVTGSVFEKETGLPEFVRPSFEISESINKRGIIESRIGDKDLDKSRAGQLTMQLLESFDKQYEHQLIQESRLALEATQASDFNLPYSVSRTIIREAIPLLVAVNVFDVQTTDQAPSKIFYEKYAHETGVEADITDEDVTFAANALVQDLAHNNIKSGTVVVKNDNAGDPGATTYVEGTDYIIEYGFGQIFRLSTGSIGATDLVHVAYTYSKIREGEMAAIQRGKQTLSTKDLAIAADRLASQISSEAIAFARSQLGEDAQARSIAGIIRQIQTHIDRRLFSMAKFAIQQVASNSGGSFSVGTVPDGVTFDKHLITLERYIGVAKVKVENRYYTPNAIWMSMTNAEMLSNSERFKAAGDTPGYDLNAAGYVGRIKGLPVFGTTEVSDDLIGISHRELVQHRVFKALVLKGPFPTYDSNGNLIAADQFFVEEYNGSDVPVKEKGSYVKITA